MGYNTLIALIRNGLCVVNGLLPETHPWRDTLFEIEGSGISHISAIIAVLQLLGGFWYLEEGFGDILIYRRNKLAIQKAIDLLDEVKAKGPVVKREKGDRDPVGADENHCWTGKTDKPVELLSEHFRHIRDSLLMRLVLGWCLVSIGVSFIFFFLISLKSVELGPVVHSLSVCEIALAILLAYILYDLNRATVHKTILESWIFTIRKYRNHLQRIKSGAAIQIQYTEGNLQRLRDELNEAMLTVGDVRSFELILRLYSLDMQQVYQRYEKPDHPKKAFIRHPWIPLSVGSTIAAGGVDTARVPPPPPGQSSPLPSAASVHERCTTWGGICTILAYIAMCLEEAEHNREVVLTVHPTTRTPGAGGGDGEEEEEEDDRAKDCAAMEQSARSKAIEDADRMIDSATRMVEKDGRRIFIDSIVLLLNLIAFFGYGLIPYAYYLSGYEQYFREVLGQYYPEHAYLVWVGNLAGDLAWTVEPAILLSMPRLNYY